jgi:CheY-like chemotaxis protein
METTLEPTMLNAERACIRPIILVIDDTPDQLFLHKTILEAEDYEVVAAAGGGAALDVLRDITPHLILLDMQMQDMSGNEFLAELEKTRPKIFDDVPVVFVTAMDTAPMGKAAGFIRKPLDIGTFLADIQRYIQEGNARRHRRQ